MIAQPLSTHVLFEHSHAVYGVVLGLVFSFRAFQCPFYFEVRVRALKRPGGILAAGTTP